MNFDHIEHYGVQGMRWGVRNDRRLDRASKKQHKQYEKEIAAAVKRDTKTVKKLSKQQYGSRKWEEAVKDMEYKINTVPAYEKALVKQYNRNAALTTTAVTGAAFLMYSGIAIGATRR